MNKFIPLPPTCLIPQCGNLHTESPNWLFCLAHVAQTHPEYREAFTDFSLNGNQPRVLLDNGAFELGEGIATTEVIEVAKTLNCPVEIVLSDSMFNGVETLKRSEEDLNLYHKVMDGTEHQWSFMGVPQGKDLKEWLWTLDQMVAIGVKTIGVSQKYDQKFVGWGGRLRLVEELDRHYSSDIVCHLLGVSHNVEDLKRVVGHPRVRSFDTAKAIYYGKAGSEHRMEELPWRSTGRPDDYFGLPETSFNIFTVMGNIEYLNSL